MSGTETTVTGMLITAIAALASVVAYLYRTSSIRIEKEIEEVNEKLNECEDDRTRLWQMYNGLALFIARQFNMSSDEIEQQVQQGKRE